MKQDLKERRELISFEAPRVMKKRLICNTFMAFKNMWTLKKTNNNTIRPMLDKLNKKLVLDSMTCWKWLIYYKQNKRRFIKYMQEKQRKAIIRDVFNGLNNYRLIIYNLVSKTDKLTNMIIAKSNESSFSKIKNCANYEKEELDYERRRSLYILLNKKLSSIHIIKRKILHKWNSLLIAR